VKPAPFAYTKAKTLKEAVTLLAKHKDDARLLAGGQSLIATLNMRLSAPDLLIDINGIKNLNGIAKKGKYVEIGALARHAQVEHSDVVAKHAPLIALAMPHIGHPAIRNRGTFGGSIAFADPAAELPACLLALGGEIDIAGCALVYPTGPRSFFSLCGDGTALTVRLDDAGKAAGKARTAKLFDAVKDPVTEKGVRRGDTWYFVSFTGDVVPLQTTGGTTKAGARWSLLDAADRKASWRPGGMQHLSLHAASGRLYSLMHKGGEYSHKDPGTEVWVYDLSNRKRQSRFALEAPATSINITQDANPVLFAIFIGAGKVDVYDPKGGKLLRSIAEIGFTPTTLVSY